MASSSMIAIPHAAVPGKLDVVLNLTKDDLRIAIQKLSNAAQELARRRATGALTGPPSGPTPPPQAQPAAAPPPAVQAPAAAAAAVVPPPAVPRQQPGAVPAASAATPAAHRMPPQPAALPSFLPLPGQVAAQAAPPAPAPRPRPPPVQPPPPRPAVQPPAAAVRPPPAYAAPQPAAAPAPAAAAPGGMSWQLCWSTDPHDHNNDPVSAMAYLPSLPGLPGGDNHAGWMISSSRALLNLWECSPSGGRGEPALICMHSQATDYAYACLEADRTMQLLLGASIDRSGAEWVTLGSLDVDTGMLAFKGRCPMPQPGVARIPGQNHLQVVSLHSFGAALDGCCAASYGGGIAVWQVGTLQKLNRPQAPRATWKAHNSKITALHKSNFKLCLFSGAEDGTVHMWSMREKPTAPQITWRHGGRVAGVQQANEHQVVTAAADGRVMVWDLRQPADPVKFAVPDGKPLHRIAVSPFADSVAVAGAGGVYCVDLLDAACHVTPVSPAAPRAPITSLAWNASTSEIMVGGGAGGSGSVSVYRQRVPYL